MAKNYAKQLPVDKDGNVYPVSTPNFPANQSWSSVFSVSSTIGLSDSTTAIQIAAIGAAAQIRWGTGSVTGTTFDATIPANTQILFAVPINSFPTGGSVMGANGANGLYNSISIKTVGGNTGSVFGAEY